MRKIIVAVAALTLYLSVSSAFGGSDVQSEPDVILTPGAVVEATLRRNNNIITVSAKVYGLDPGETYTAWWVVFPEGDFAVVPMIMNASGGIANQHGVLSFGAALQTGTYEDGDTKPRFVLFGGTLEDPRSAAVIIDVLDHGPKIPGRVSEQISTLGAGCETPDPNDVDPDCPSAAAVLFLPITP